MTKFFAVKICIALVIALSATAGAQQTGTLFMPSCLDMYATLDSGCKNFETLDCGKNPREVLKAFRRCKLYLSDEGQDSGKAPAIMSGNSQGSFKRGKNYCVVITKTGTARYYSEEVRGRDCRQACKDMAKIRACHDQQDGLIPKDVAYFCNAFDGPDLGVIEQGHVACAATASTLPHEQSPPRDVGESQGQSPSRLTH